MTMLEIPLSLAESLLVRGAGLQNRFPPLFVVGAPRSGTTIVYQHLVNRFHFAYFPNRVRGHPFTCVSRTAWGRLVERYRPSYNNEFGRIEGGMAPSDGWEVFHRWFPRYELDRPVDTSRLHELRRIVWLLERLFRAPFINKNNANSVRIPYLRALFPNALFLHVVRDRTDTAVSLLGARLAHGVELGGWWSAAPPQFLDHGFQDDAEQAMAQVVGVRSTIEEDLAEAPDRVIGCRYEDFCAKPDALSTTVVRAYSERGVALRARRNHVQPSLSPRRHEPDRALRARLRRAEAHVLDEMARPRPGVPLAPRRGPDDAEGSRRLREYGRTYPLTHPAYGVARVAARQIRAWARLHFRGRLIDIGSGTKQKALLVGDLVTHHVGLDHAASPHGLQAVDVVGSAYELPLADESFDCALSTAVLEHLEEPQRALRESFRVVSPGGIAIYTAPLFWHLHEEPRDFFRYTRHGLRHLFEEAGFRIVEIRPLGGFWLTFGTQLAYYLQGFRHGPLRWLVDGWTAAGNTLWRHLDRGRARDERFTWMYLVVARRPLPDRRA